MASRNTPTLSDLAWIRVTTELVSICDPPHPSRSPPIKLGETGARLGGRKHTWNRYGKDVKLSARHSYHPDRRVDMFCLPKLRRIPATPVLMTLLVAFSQTLSAHPGHGVDSSGGSVAHYVLSPFHSVPTCIALGLATLVVAMFVQLILIRAKERRESVK